MKRETLKKKMYVTPYMELHHAALDGYLMETSFPNNGGHTKADDDGQVLNAKQNSLFEEEEEENENSFSGWNI